ncbi:hypothetical protein AXF42_Ash003432 [Apostasia shenzhenica]|uniref:DUF632 domain-containing protein n=1 Tax=Apostasia shenzhenica TaxID=1088818 RepID=A0A2I0BG74_9ASPA|nr:hypothetical protein AXF42_Ash003432 [Apostasia shenzhenica]
MGCGSSRADDSSLVALCRQRMALVREAADCRFALAKAHAAYFRGIAGIGNALVHFAAAGEGVAPAFPAVVLPPMGKGAAGGECGSGRSSASPLSHSFSEEVSHVLLSSEFNAEMETVLSEGKGGEPSSVNSPQHPNPNFHYNKSATAIPSIVYQGPSALATSYWRFGGFPSRMNIDEAYYDIGGSGIKHPKPDRADSLPPPPPAAAQGSNWEFFEQIFSYEQFPAGHLNRRHGKGSFGSSGSSSEVRKREGIPDLEEDTEPELPKKGKIEKEVGKKDSVNEVSEFVLVKGNGKVNERVTNLEEKKSMNSSVEEESKLSSTEAGKNITSANDGSKGSSSMEEIEMISNKKGVSFRSLSSVVMEKGGSTDTLMSGEVISDVLELLKNVEEDFQSAIFCSKEISDLLEVGKASYSSRNKMFKAISSRNFGVGGFSMSFHTCFKHGENLEATEMENSSNHVDFNKQTGRKFGNLSSTFEKLYAWEKKLFWEVQEEERLRAIYDRKCKRLKSMDVRGAEPHKVVPTQASIRSLRTKITISINTVDVISRRLHRIMDEELQPQLVELINGLTRMWKHLLGFHQKQLQAVLGIKPHNLTFRIAAKGSFAKATVDLELELSNWCSCFLEWISSQKDFVTSLNGWLMKWLPDEREEASDGIDPFSPSRIGAPPICVLSNDWHQAMRLLVESKVKEAIQSFAVGIHKISEDFEQKCQILEDSSGELKTLQSEHWKLDTGSGKLDKTLGEVGEFASASLRTGLIQVFQALENFSSASLQAYEGLRLPEEGFGTD